jgi:hypothetical protein
MRCKRRIQPSSKVTVRGNHNPSGRNNPNGRHCPNGQSNQKGKNY